VKTEGKARRRVPDPIVKRKLFDGIAEGIVALAEQRQGKRTLRTHKVELKERA
jgi:hypothetical protein